MHNVTASTRLYHRRRDEFITQRGGKCEICKSVSDLEIDHLEPAFKSMAPGDALMRRREIREKELAKCQVLCGSCHAKKTRRENLGRCGTRAGYMKQGCRCDLCKSWCREFTRANRARWAQAKVEDARV